MSTGRYFSKIHSSKRILIYGLVLTLRTVRLSPIRSGSHGFFDDASPRWNYYLVYSVYSEFTIASVSSCETRCCSRKVDASADSSFQHPLFRTNANHGGLWVNSLSQCASSTKRSRTFLVRKLSATSCLFGSRCTAFI